MILTPNNSISSRPIGVWSVYLAGSDEKETQNWQSYVDNELDKLGYTVFNPRVEEEHKDPLWELMAMERSNFIIMYFDEKSDSFFDLFALGKYSTSDKLVICCPDKFWAKEWIDMVCEHYDIPQIQNLKDIITYFKNLISH